MPAKTALTTEQPWPGAAPYGAADRPYFHGRRRETEELLRLLNRDVVTLVLGAKGVGKTSLIHAGLLPSLTEGEWLAVVPNLDWTAKPPVTAAADINADQPMSLANPLTRQLLASLNAAATQRGLSSPQAGANETLWEFFHRAGNRWWSSRQRVVTPVIIIDSFESVFTTARQNATARRHAEAFLEELSQLAANRPPQRLITQIDAGESRRGAEFDFDPIPIRIVLVLAEEFTAELTTLRSWFPTLRHCELRVEAFTPSQAREVLMRGGLQGSLFTEGALDATVSRLARDAGSDGRISPAHLSALAQALAAERKTRGTGQITPDFISAPNTQLSSPAPAQASVAPEPNDLHAKLAAAENSKRRSNRLATIAFLLAIAAFAIPQMVNQNTKRETAAVNTISDAPLTQQPAAIQTPVEPALENPFSTQPAEFLPAVPADTPTPAPPPAVTRIEPAITTPIEPPVPTVTTEISPASVRLQSPPTTTPILAEPAGRPADSALSPEARRQMEAATADRKAEQERMKREFLKQKDERSRTRRPESPDSSTPRR